MKKEDAIELMYEDGCKLGELSEDLRKDSEVVMAAVQNCGAALEHVLMQLHNFVLQPSQPRYLFLNLQIVHQAYNHLHTLVQLHLLFSLFLSFFNLQMDLYLC